ncbi:YqaJ viral recombinase family protein, partial [Listeria monocytogenes]|uniref:YqaJ viral recombinase family protein n=1 Tax=Listeria monocytogenes TaxID=1639 RepID=UPI003211D447
LLSISFFRVSKSFISRSKFALSAKNSLYFFDKITCLASDLAKEWEADEVPATYLVQIQHYLAVTGKSKAYVAVLIGGNKF